MPEIEEPIEAESHLVMFLRIDSVLKHDVIKPGGLAWSCRHYMIPSR